MLNYRALSRQLQVITLDIQNTIVLIPAWILYILSADFRGPSTQILELLFKPMVRSDELLVMRPQLRTLYRHMCSTGRIITETVKPKYVKKIRSQCHLYPPTISHALPSG